MVGRHKNGQVRQKRDEIILYEVDQDVPDELSHIHATDHLLEGLLPRVEAFLMNGPVPFGENEVQFTIVSKCSPLSIDDHIFLLGELLCINSANVRNLL